MKGGRDSQSNSSKRKSFSQPAALPHPTQRRTTLNPNNHHRTFPSPAPQALDVANHSFTAQSELHQDSYSISENNVLDLPEDTPGPPSPCEPDIETEHGAPNPEPDTNLATNVATHSSDMHYKNHRIPDADYISGRILLMQELESLNPPPPLDFADRLLDLFRDLVYKKNFELNRKHTKQKTFMRQLRKYTGMTKRPDCVPVNLERTSFTSWRGIFEGAEEGVTQRESASVMVWNPANQIKSILGDRTIFGDLNNIMVNGENDPFSKYVSPDGKLSELVTGKWYRETYDMIEAKHLSRVDAPGQQPFWVVPIMLGSDATCTDQHSRFKVEPIMMSLGLIKHSIRREGLRAWRPLGLMPPLNVKSKNARKIDGDMGSSEVKGMKYGVSTRNYHRCLRAILQPLVNLQKTGLTLSLYVGSQKRTVHCYFPLAVWMGDIMNHDYLVGRIVNHQPSTRRLCWQCHCQFKDLDSPDTMTCQKFCSQQYRLLVQGCEDISVFNTNATENMFYGGSATDAEKQMYLNALRDGELDNLVAEKESFYAASLQEHGLPEGTILPEKIMTIERLTAYKDQLRVSYACNRVDSIMNELDYGAVCAGYGGAQFQACAIDILHSLMGGVIQKVCDCFISGLNSSAKGTFERVADKIFLRRTGSEWKFMPRMNFTHGYTNVTELTCREWVGLLLACLVVCRSYTGATILDNYAKNTIGSKKKKNRVNQNPPVLVDDSEMVEEDDWGDATDVESITPADFVELAESMLCYFGYLKSDHFWEVDDTNSALWAQESCNILLKMMQDKCHFNTGNGWKRAKVHAMFKRAVPHIVNFGSPKHTDTDLFEALLRQCAKRPAANTSRQSYAAVTKQTAARLDEHFVLSYASSLFLTEEKAKDQQGLSNPSISNSNPPDEKNQSVMRDGVPSQEKVGVVRRSPEWGERIHCHTSFPFSAIQPYIWQRRFFDINQDPGRNIRKKKGWFTELRTPASQKSLFHFCPMIEALLKRFYFKAAETAAIEPRHHDLLGISITCTTELFLSTGKRIRCHPNYSNKGMASYDWVLLRDDPNKGRDLLTQGYLLDHETYFLPKHRYESATGSPMLRYPFLNPKTSRLLSKRKNKTNNKMETIFNNELYEKLRYKEVTKHLLLQHVVRKDDLTDQETLLLPPSKQKKGADNDAFLKSFLIGDLPAHEPEFKSEYEKRFGDNVVPAKVLLMFKEPTTGNWKAVVHCCKRRTLENFYKSSVLLTDWTLQYQYRTHEQSANVDIMVASYNVIDISTEVIDRIAVVEPELSNNDSQRKRDYINPDQITTRSLNFGVQPVKIGGRELAVREDREENYFVRRQVSDVLRTVMVMEPTEHWGYCFTREYKSNAN